MPAEGCETDAGWRATPARHTPDAPRDRYIQPGGTLQSTGVSLRGQPKFSGALVEGLNGTRIGVQSRNTTVGSFDGPQQSIDVSGPLPPSKLAAHLGFHAGCGTRQA